MGCHRYFRLAVLLKEKYQLVQLGMPGESVIPGAKDLREVECQTNCGNLLIVVLYRAGWLSNASLVPYPLALLLFMVDEKIMAVGLPLQ